MFWCLEEKSRKYLQSSNLLYCILFCVSKLKSFVDKAFLQNYFIRERNQIVASDFTPDIQTKTRQYLETVLEDSNAAISFLLPLNRKYANTQICTLQNWSQKNAKIIGPI